MSPFWAFFLEFFGLGNNLTLQDHYYTRAITLILGIERNEKNHFSMGLFLQDLQEFLRISCAARQDSCKISYSCRKHYLQAKSLIRTQVVWRNVLFLFFIRCLCF